MSWSSLVPQHTAGCFPPCQRAAGGFPAGGRITLGTSQPQGLVLLPRELPHLPFSDTNGKWTERESTFQGRRATAPGQKANLQEPGMRSTWNPWVHRVHHLHAPCPAVPPSAWAPVFSASSAHSHAHPARGIGFGGREDSLQTSKHATSLSNLQPHTHTHTPSIPGRPACNIEAAVPTLHQHPAALSHRGSAQRCTHF